MLILTKLKTQKLNSIKFTQVTTGEVEDTDRHTHTHKKIEQIVLIVSPSGNQHRLSVFRLVVSLIADG